MIKKLFIILIISTFILAGCQVEAEDVLTIVEEATPQDEVEELVVPEYIEIQISGVGDLMVHGPQLRAQYNNDTKEYSFDNNFKYIKPYLQQADLMLGNLETTFAGGEKGYSSYPLFNTPDDLADALKSAGFHSIATANNHSFDTGKGGMVRTLEVLKDRGLITFGTRSSLEEDSYTILDVEGITVGLSSYTYETPMQGGQRAINAIPLPKDVQPLIDTFSYEMLEEDLEVIRQRVEEMKALGTELVVFYMHWGNEYHRQPNKYQKRIAQALSNYGVDIIFGSHPHVIQPIEILESEIDGRSTVVIYSMGNFLSNQRYEILSNRFTEDGIIVNVKVKKNLSSSEIMIEEVSYVPTWVHRYFEGGKAVYEIIPTYDAVNAPNVFGVTTENTLWRVTNSQQNTIDIVESGEGQQLLKPVFFTLEDFFNQ